MKNVVLVLLNAGFRTNLIADGAAKMIETDRWNMSLMDFVAINGREMALAFLIPSVGKLTLTSSRTKTNNKTS